jgi:uncharacterized C2H2 Zn-finger protein
LDDIKCPTCGAPFAAQDELMEHNKQAHGGAM